MRLMRAETEEGHLGGDPAADGVSDDRHVFEPQGVEQVAVEGGELGHAVELVRPGCATEAGVNRGEHPDVADFGKQLREPGDGLWTGAAVQHQKRAARRLALLPSAQRARRQRR